MAAELALAVADLRVGYGSGRDQIAALAGVTLEVPAGCVFGLVGRNGAGKSSLLRCLAGLVGADAGSVDILGHPMPAARRQVADRMGCLVDRPGALAGLSGTENLRALARRHGVGRPAVQEAVERCGLAPVAARQVATYSLGQRQRLGIAMALLGGPELLLLDEPTNGLDPEGIAWMRELVRSHAAAGGTVVLASHLLAEVGAVCHEVAVLHRGRIAACGPLATVTGAIEVVHELEVTGPADRSVAVLRRHGIAATADASGVIALRAPAPMRDAVSLHLAAEGIGVRRLVPATGALEQLIVSLEAS